MQVGLGQELARLETSQAEADLRFAKTGVLAARASLRRLAAEEERARVALEAAEREETRTRPLFAWERSRSSSATKRPTGSAYDVVRD